MAARCLKPWKAVSLTLCLSPLLWLAEQAQALAGEEPRPAESVARPHSTVLAGMLTAVNIPARGIVCVGSGLLGGVVMLASGGTRYRDAGGIVVDGCSGPWIITGEMLTSSRSNQEESKPAR